MQAPNFCAPLKPPTKYSVESYEPDDEPEPSKIISFLILILMVLFNKTST